MQTSSDRARSVVSSATQLQDYCCKCRNRRHLIEKSWIPGSFRVDLKCFSSSGPSIFIRPSSIFLYNAKRCVFKPSSAENSSLPYRAQQSVCHRRPPPTECHHRLH